MFCPMKRERNFDFHLSISHTVIALSFPLDKFPSISLLPGTMTCVSTGTCSRALAEQRNWLTWWCRTTMLRNLWMRGKCKPIVKRKISSEWKNDRFSWPMDRLLDEVRLNLAVVAIEARQWQSMVDDRYAKVSHEVWVQTQVSHMLFGKKKKYLSLWRVPFVTPLSYLTVWPPNQKQQQSIIFPVQFRMSEGHDDSLVLLRVRSTSLSGRVFGEERRILGRGFQRCNAKV